MKETGRELAGKPVQLANGITYHFAPVGLTDAACDLLEQLASGENPSPKLLRQVIRESLEFAGHDADEIEAAVNRGATADKWEDILRAMLPGDVKPDEAKAG